MRTVGPRKHSSPTTNTNRRGVDKLDRKHCNRYFLTTTGFHKIDQKGPPWVTQN
jgi:hypothetical protein